MGGPPKADVAQRLCVTAQMPWSRLVPGDDLVQQTEDFRTVERFGHAFRVQYFQFSMVAEFKVVGNIYENPGLLK